MSEKYRVECMECGMVECDVLDESWFSNKYAALWYAGYHCGNEHPDSRFQLATPTRVEE